MQYLVWSQPMPRGAPSDDEWRRAGVPMAPQAHCRTPPLINLQSRDLPRPPRTGTAGRGGTPAQWEPVHVGRR